MGAHQRLPLFGNALPKSVDVLAFANVSPATIAKLRSLGLETIRQLGLWMVFNDLAEVLDDQAAGVKQAMKRILR